MPDNLTPETLVGLADKYPDGPSHAHLELYAEAWKAQLAADRKRMETWKQLAEDSWVHDDEMLGENCIHCKAKVRGHRESPFDPKNPQAEAVWVYESGHDAGCRYAAALAGEGT